MRTPKTREIKVIQTNYGYGWEDESWYERDEYNQIKHDFQEYKRHMIHYGGCCRLITRRVQYEDD